MTAPAISTTQAVDLYLRLWTKIAADGANPPTAWTDGTPLMRMLCQVIKLGGGVPGEAQPGGLPMARFAGEFQAVRCARQIQALVTGFASADGQRTMAASIAIFTAPDLAAGPSGDPGARGHATSLRAYLEQQAQPAQILFSSVGDSSPLQNALRTRPMESLTLPGQRSGQTFPLHEVLWRDKEQAAAAAVQARAKAAKQRQPVPAAPALPVEPRNIRPSLAERGSDWREDTASMLVSLRDKIYAFAGRVTAAATSHAARPYLQNRFLRMGVAGAMLVVLTVFLLVHRRSTSAAKMAVTPPTASSTPASAATVPDGMSAKAPAAERSIPPRRVEPPKKTQTSEEAERPARGRGELTPEQTRQVLSRGQTELDRGCYSRAIAYYRRVLDDDPRNGSASSGIEKARRRMQLDGGSNPACQ